MVGLACRVVGLDGSKKRYCNGPDSMNSSTADLEVEKLRFERQKAAVDALLKRRELRTAPKSSLRTILENPLSLAIIGGALTLLSSVVGAYLNTQSQLKLEEMKAEFQNDQAQQSLQADLIKQMAAAPNVATARENLKFLVGAGLIPAYEARVQKYIADNPNAAPLVGASGDLGSRIVVPAAAVSTSNGMVTVLRNGSTILCNGFRIRLDLVATEAGCLLAATSATFQSPDRQKPQNINLSKYVALKGRDGQPSIGIAPLSDVTDADQFYRLSRTPLHVGSRIQMVFRLDANWYSSSCRVVSLESDVIHHDCKTGDGSSGSALIQNGVAVAVHFGRDDKFGLAYRLDGVVDDIRKNFGELP